MTDQPGSARFQALLESAVQVYEKTAGVSLASSEDPLAMRLQCCHSVDDIATLLQHQAQAIDDFQQRDRIFKAIKITVSILSPISSVASFVDNVGLVRRKLLITCFTHLPPFLQTLLPYVKAIHATLGALLKVCAIPVLKSISF